MLLSTVYFNIFQKEEEHYHDILQWVSSVLVVMLGMLDPK